MSKRNLFVAPEEVANMEIKEPIRIAQIMGKLWGGGVESVVFNYYRAIDKSKIQFDFYYDSDSTVAPPPDLIAMGANFYEIPPYQKLVPYCSTLKKILREKKYIVVHSHINTLSVIPLFIAWTEKVPVRIAHNHSVPGGKEFSRNALKNFLRKFSKLFPTDYFACSEKAGRWLFGNRSFDNGKVVVIKNGIDFQRFMPGEEIVEEKRNSLGLKNKFVVGHIGRFTYAKNHKFLFEIFAEILKQKENAMLMLVGDGELHAELKKQAETLGILEHMVFTGQVSDPENYYRLANVMIFPSFFEGLPLTTIESQVAGVPVAVSEAIPKEAVISNGCKHISLRAGAKTWALESILLSEKRVNLTVKSEAYDIRKCSGELTEWYYSKIQAREMRK
ncbi:MAG TPA: glycosyltransferase family 1 protein [Lachnospiraceae bacterium]|nr:glycosyltransferase family 1 protein [Lachnospiraceae bacterium]